MWTLLSLHDCLHFEGGKVLDTLYDDDVIIIIIIGYFLLLGSIQPRDVHPLSNAKYVCLMPYLPCFCSSWSPSPGSSMIVAVFLFFSYRAVSSGKSSSANDYHSKEMSIHFSFLLWILSKIDCSACILLLMLLFVIFCNLDTVADMDDKYIASKTIYVWTKVLIGCE